MDSKITAYDGAVHAIKTAILQGQYEASKGVNRIQLATYYGVGRYLSQHTRKGVWGTGALKVISEQLQRELPGLRGFSETNLKNMRKFYDGWSNFDAKSAIAIADLANDETKDSNLAVAIADFENDVDIHHTLLISEVSTFPTEDFFNVPFTHHIRILEHSKSLPERYYYIHRTAQERLSVEALKAAMARDAYNHRSDLPNNFSKTMGNAAAARKAVMMFKDEYLLNFINTEQIGERDELDIDERVIEQQIIHNIKNFIMTFGRDFAFIGNQYQLEAYGENFFPDLLFFNRELNAMVCVELKTGSFKPSYLGQLATYLRILDDKVKKSHENPSIGIILCKKANMQFVEYVVQDYDKPMGVATYKTANDMPEPLRRALPNEKQLSKLLDGATVDNLKGE